MSTPRMAVLGPYASRVVLTQLARGGWDSGRARSTAAMLRDRGRPDLAGQLEAGLAQLNASAAEWIVEASDPPDGPAVSVDGSGEAEIGPVGAGSSREELTTDQAARMLSRSPRRVGQLLAAGDLAGRRVGRSWLVERESVEDLLALWEARKAS